MHHFVLWRVFFYTRLCLTHELYGNNSDDMNVYWMKSTKIQSDLIRKNLRYIFFSWETFVVTLSGMRTTDGLISKDLAFQSLWLPEAGWKQNSSTCGMCRIPDVHLETVLCRPSSTPSFWAADVCRQMSFLCVYFSGRPVAWEVIEMIIWGVLPIEPYKKCGNCKLN